MICIWCDIFWNIEICVVSRSHSRWYNLFHNPDSTKQITNSSHNSASVWKLYINWLMLITDIKANMESLRITWKPWKKIGYYAESDFCLQTGNGNRTISQVVIILDGSYENVYVAKLTLGSRIRSSPSRTTDISSSCLSIGSLFAYCTKKKNV